MQSDAKTVDEYLDSLPDDRKGPITALRNTIVENLPKGYEEQMRWGMITYEVPFSIKAETYNNQPLMYAALASQKKSHGRIFERCVSRYETSREIRRRL